MARRMNEDFILEARPVPVRPARVLIDRRHAAQPNNKRRMPCRKITEFIGDLSP